MWSQVPAPPRLEVVVAGGGASRGPSGAPTEGPCAGGCLRLRGADSEGFETFTCGACFFIWFTRWAAI